MKRLQTIFYLTALGIFTILIFMVFSVVWLVTLPFDRNRWVLHRVSRYWSWSIYALCPWWDVRVRGRKNVKKGERYVVISNHQAMLDIPLLYTLPLDFRWVSKREVYKIPVFGWVLWMHGDVAIERGGAASAYRMMQKCTRYLDRGISIIMFPEGTRTKTGRIGTFKEGSFTLARSAGAGILPVVIDGTFDAFKDGNVNTPHTFHVHILPPVSAGEVAAADPKELRDRLQQLMTAEHQTIAGDRYR